MLPNTAPRFLLILAAFALFAAACGSSGETANATPDTDETTESAESDGTDSNDANDDSADDGADTEVETVTGPAPTPLPHGPLPQGELIDFGPAPAIPDGDLEADLASVVDNLFGDKLITQEFEAGEIADNIRCLLYTSPSPRDATLSRMPSSA